MSSKKDMQKKDWIIIGVAIVVTLFFNVLTFTIDYFETCNGCLINLTYHIIIILAIFCYKKPKRIEYYFIFIIVMITFISMAILSLKNCCGYL